MIARALLARAKPPTVQPVFHGGMWPGHDHHEILPTATEAQALDLPVVSAALNITVSLVRQMPLRAYTADGKPADPTPTLLVNPAPGPGRTRSDWVCESLHDLALFGNHVAVIGDPAWNGWPTEVYPVPAGQWSIRPDGTYLIGSDVYQRQDVLHIRRGCRTGDMVGRGLLDTHPRLVASAVAAEQWASRYFDGGAAPPVVVRHPSAELTQDQATSLKTKFRAATRRREPVIVPAGTEITAINADADKAQLADARRWGAQQLAIALGVPPPLLSLEGPSFTYKTLQDLYAQFISTTVMGYLIPIEEALSMLLPRTLTARFDPTNVLRPDLPARVQLAVKGLVGGVYQPDEARHLVDLSPLPAAPNLSVVDPVKALSMITADDEEAAR